MTERRLNSLKTRWPVEIETLSPVHIGSGHKLQLGYDVVVREGRTYRVREEALFAGKLDAAGGDQSKVERLLRGLPAVQLLDATDYQRRELFRYILPGEPRDAKNEGFVQEQIKDAFDCAYIPGSTLKGALRTTLLWGILSRCELAIDHGRLNDDRRYAAQPLERMVMGPDPNHDWLRAMLVADSRGLACESCLRLVTCCIYRSHKPSSREIAPAIEALAADTSLAMELAVDEYLLSDQVAEKLGWQGKRSWLAYLVALAQDWARQHIAREAQFFENGPDGPRDFYRTLARRLDGLQENEFLLQIGWGAGWEAKTLGSDLLRQNDGAFEALVARYDMTTEETRWPGDPYPRTRALTLQGDRLADPMGWVKVRLLGYHPGAAPECFDLPEPQPKRTEPRAARGRQPSDLEPEQILTGTVENTAAFGLFVDVGVGANGLVHISQIADRRIESTELAAMFSRGQRVRVRVLRSPYLESGKWRIPLSLKGVSQEGD